MKRLLVLAVAATGLAADESPAVIRARQELDRVRGLVAAGALAPARLAEAQQGLEDASDEAVLERTLYGRIEIEDLSERQADDMVAAAERRARRQHSKLAHAQTLIEQGVAERTDFSGLESEMEQRRLALDQAYARAALVREIVEIAQAEALAAEHEREAVREQASKAAEEYVEGDRLLEPKGLKALTLAFEKEFGKPMPVSARGSTAVHRAMGFDHTGRVDVAMNPDAPEGVWLRKYLEERAIPYDVFRAAIPGKATAPHIHIGPGSTRISD